MGGRYSDSTSPADTNPEILTHQAPFQNGKILRSVPLFELVLVVLIACGMPILSSVYPLIGNLENSQLSWQIYSLLHTSLPIVSSLALLGYVLFRKQEIAASKGASSGGHMAAVKSLQTLLSSLQTAARHMRLSEWCLVLMPALIGFITRWAVIGIARVDFAAGLFGDLTNLAVAACPIVYNAIPVCILGYVLRCRAESFGHIGLHWNFRWSVGMALLLWFLGDLLQSVLTPLTYWLAQTIVGPTWHPPDVAEMLYPAHQLTLAVIPSRFVNAVNEELIVRAFLMTTILRITPRSWVAVVISVAVQTSYHFYQGIPAALSHLGLFTLYAIFYVKTRSILPVILNHAFVDLSIDWEYGLRTILSH